MTMSQSVILNNLKQQEVPASIAASMPSMVKSDDPMQDELSYIAERATNFGYGAGHALRVAIEKLKILCHDIKQRSLDNHFVNYLFYDSIIGGFFLEMERAGRTQKLVEQCHESVSELEKIENEMITSRRPG